MAADDTGQRAVDRIERWVRPDIRALRAYHIEEPSGLIKLDAMENPYQWPEELRARWAERLRDIAINRYPDPRAQQLRERARQVLAIPESFGVMFGNGSDELIQMLCTLVSGANRKILVPEPSFEMYGLIARINGLEVIGVPLDAENYTVREKAVLEHVEREHPAVTFLASPNNPTGACVSTDFIRKLASRSSGLVLVDEAYCRFAGGSVMHELTGIDNLLLMQTFSKIGLAGLRIGLLMGDRAWLNEFEKVRMPYNVGSLAQASAVFALEHIDVIDAQTALICAERARMLEALRAFDGVTVWPSQANFMLLRVPRGDMAFRALRDAGILVKNLHGKHPMLRDCLRVTVGRSEENQRFVAALSEFLSHQGD